MRTQTTSLLDHFASQTLDVKNIFKEFSKPILSNVFFTNLAALRLESDYYEFTNDRWIQRPTIFCMDNYDEPLLYPIIMLVNNIKTFFEFTPERFAPTIKNQRIIIAPYRNIISKILSTSKMR
jgi:hypothetical protein